MDDICRTYKKVERTIFVMGVFPESCHSIEDEFENRFTYEDEIVPKTIYDKIPEIFTCVEEWPKTTNISCWSCTLTFNTIPWFIPLSIEPNPAFPHKHIIPPKGCFCSPNCAFVHICKTYHDVSTRNDAIAMLKLLYNIITKKTCIDILPSPVHTVLEKYGGNVSEDNFKKRIGQIYDCSSIKH